MNFLDGVTLDGPKRTSEGYLVADAFTVRTGIQRYAGYEVERPDLQFVDVYRPEEEVFKTATLQSFSHVPVTNDHPSVMVDSTNWKDLAVGEASSDVLRDGERMKIPLILKDAATISAVESGKRQLSAGYTCKLDWTPGTTPSGESYQAVQRDIKANHIAIVAKGRAGSEFRIGDADAWGVVPVTDKDSTMNLRTVVVDGISIQTTDQGAEALAKKDAALSALNGEKAQLTADNLSLAAKVQAHETALGAKDAEIAALKAIDHSLLIEARSALVDSAKKVVPDLDPKGMKDSDIRRAVVVKTLGEEKVKTMSDAAIEGAFEYATKDAAPFRPTFATAPQGGSMVTDSQRSYEDRIRNGWKQ